MKHFPKSPSTRRRKEAGHFLAVLLLKSTVREQRSAEVAHADQHDRLQLRPAEDVGDFFAERGDFVPESTCAEMAKEGQVLPQLRRFNARSVCQ